MNEGNIRIESGDIVCIEPKAEVEQRTYAATRDVSEEEIKTFLREQENACAKEARTAFVKRFDLTKVELTGVFCPTNHEVMDTLQAAVVIGEQTEIALEESAPEAA